MKDAEIYAELEEIFADLFPGQTISLRPDLTAAEVDGWDSSRHLNLILAVEVAFDVRLSVREIESIKTLGDLVALVAAKTS